MTKSRQLGCFLMLLGAMAMPCLAQNPAPAPDNGGGGGGGGGGGRGGRGGGGGFDPAQFRQRMLDQIKEALGASDEEFKALSPKIEQISALRTDLYSSGIRQMMRRRGGGGGGGADTGAARPGGGAGGADAQPSAIRAASDALQAVLDNKDAKPEDVKVKLAALRDARTKGKADLAKLQDDLKGLLTSRQEAVMLEYGFIE